MIAALIPDDGILDDIAIERVIDGGEARLTRLERLAVIERMTERGYSAARIAERVGCAGRTITRTRTRLRDDTSRTEDREVVGNFPQSPTTRSTSGAFAPDLVSTASDASVPEASELNARRNFPIPRSGRRTGTAQKGEQVAQPSDDALFVIPQWWFDAGEQDRIPLISTSASCA